MNVCIRRFVWLTLALWFVTVVAAAAAVEVKTTTIVKSNLVEKVAGGEIDWGKEMFYAQGQGAMPSAAEEPNRSRAYLKAKDYAKIDAIANMKMLIEGCSISYEATGKDYMVQDATLRQKIEGYVKNVEILKIDKKKVEGDTIVVVTVGCRMYGNDSPGNALLQKMSEMALKESLESEPDEVKISIPGTPTKTVEVKPEPIITPEEKPTEVKPVEQIPAEVKPVEQQPAEVKATEEKPADEKIAETKPEEVKPVEKPAEVKVVQQTIVVKPFTGVIINTVGLHVYRAMSPKIRTQNGVEVYGTIKMDPDDVQDRGPVIYSRTLVDAKKSPHSGGNPLVIKAVGRAGGLKMCDVVLSDGDVSKLKDADNAANPSFLKEMNVIFIVDPVQIL